MRLVLGMMACAALTGRACDKYRGDDTAHADDAKITTRDNGATITPRDQSNGPQKTR
jgi:hypothetical protein